MTSLFDELLSAAQESYGSLPDTTDTVNSGTLEQSASRVDSSPSSVSISRDLREECENFVNAQIPRRVSSKTREPSRPLPLSSQFLPRERQNILNLDRVQRLYTAGCGCKQNCLWTISLDAIIKTRKENAHLNREQRKLELARVLQEQRVSPESTHFRYQTADKRPLCLKAWMLYQGIGGKMYASARDLALNGARRTVHGSCGKKRNWKVQWVSAWLAEYFRSVCDPQVSGSGERLMLPAHVRWSDVYDKLCASWAEDIDLPENAKPPVMSTVYAAFRSSGLKKRVVFPKAGDWGLCNVCEELKARRSAGFRNELEERDARAAQKQHDHEWQAQRQSFDRAIQHARANPDDTMLLSFDYTRALYLPHFRPNVKDALRASRVKLCIGGAINFSNNKRYLWVHTDNVEKDSKAILTVLYHVVFGALKSDHPVSRATRLHIRTDGGSENWNRWVLAFAAVLVNKRIFSEVQLTRGVVGHTHDRVDQMFRTLRGIFQRVSVATFHDFVRCVREGFTKVNTRPEVIYLQKVYNWHGWFAGRCNDIAGFKHVLGIRFTLSDMGVAVMHYKDVPALEAEWKGQGGVPGGEGLQLLHRAVRRFPELCDEPWQPSEEESVDVQQLFRFLPVPNNVNEAKRAALLDLLDSGTFLYNVDVDRSRGPGVGWPASVTLCEHKLPFLVIDQVPMNAWDRKFPLESGAPVPVGPYRPSHESIVRYSGPARVVAPAAQPRRSLRVAAARERSEHGEAKHDVADGDEKDEKSVVASLGARDTTGIVPGRMVVVKAYARPGEPRFLVGEILTAPRGREFTVGLFTSPGGEFDVYFQVLDERERPTKRRCVGRHNDLRSAGGPGSHPSRSCHRH